MSAILDSLVAERARFGVTRYGSTTALDILGVETATAVRSNAIAPGVSVHSGKGLTAEQALVGALAEALERFCAEPRSRVASARARTTATIRAVEPHALIRASWSEYRDCAIEWCVGRTLGGSQVRVPANAVLFPFEAPREELLFAAHTTGLACGETSADAALRAILECIERDQYSLAMAQLAVGLEPLGICLGRDALPVPCRSIVDRVSALGGGVSLRSVASDIPVPVVVAVIALGGEAHLGIAAERSLDRAAMSALLEAAQSRTTAIQGSREDLVAPRGSGHPWFLGCTSGERSAPPDGALAELDGGELLRVLWEEVRRVTGHEPVIVDLSLAGTPLRTVRVVCPGLETWAFDPDRVGPRVARVLGSP